MEERPPRRLDISRRGRNRAAPGLKPGAYLWRRHRKGHPAVATELPLPARAWRGLRGLFYGDAPGFPVIIRYNLLRASRCGKGPFSQTDQYPRGGDLHWSKLTKTGIFPAGGQ